MNTFMLGPPPAVAGTGAAAGGAGEQDAPAPDGGTATAVDFTALLAGILAPQLPAAPTQAQIPSAAGPASGELPLTSATDDGGSSLGTDARTLAAALAAAAGT